MKLGDLLGKLPLTSHERNAWYSLSLKRILGASETWILKKQLPRDQREEEVLKRHRMQQSSSNLRAQTKSTSQPTTNVWFNTLHVKLAAYEIVSSQKLININHKSLYFAQIRTNIVLGLPLQIKTALWTKVDLIPVGIHLRYRNFLPYMAEALVNTITFRPGLKQHIHFFSLFPNLLIKSLSTLLVLISPLTQL